MGVEGILKAVGKVLNSGRISARSGVLSGQVTTSMSSFFVCNGYWCLQRGPAVSEVRDSAATGACACGENV